MSATDDAEIDPRKVRSRARMLDAAVTLLKDGGIEAVTVEAVTKLSKVAKTTLYRHFDNAMQLRAATIERLLPPVLATPAEGPLRDRLIALLQQQADVMRDLPLQVSTLAWLATGSDRNTENPAITSLSQRIIDQYRVPFDRVLGTPEASEQLGDFDMFFVLSQLVGPLVFTKLIGLPAMNPQDCARIVDDFLAARAMNHAVSCRSPQFPPDSTHRTGTDRPSRPKQAPISDAAQK